MTLVADAHSALVIKMEDKKCIKRNFYIRDSVVPFEEDLTHEFKGHRNFFVQELPAWSLTNAFERQIRTRRQLSRDINAFLNTGKGGTLYIGILDDGTIKGINLTQYQKDHICATMTDLMNCYSPPVPRHQFKVKFVPVVEKDQIHIEESWNFDSSLTANPKIRARPHALRTNRYCWCDIDANAQLDMGVIAPFYIAEIIIKAWDGNDPRNIKSSLSKLQLYPIYQDEERKCYLRLQSSIVNYTYQDVKNLTVNQVKSVFHDRIEKMKAELLKLHSQI